MPNSEERRTDLQYDLKLMGSEREIEQYKGEYFYLPNKDRIEPTSVRLIKIAKAESALVESLSTEDAKAYLHERVLLAKRFADKIN